MDTINDAKLKKLLSSDDGHETTADHRVRMNEQIRAKHSKKIGGKMNYTSLGDVRREFGFDAPSNRQTLSSPHNLPLGEAEAKSTI